MDAADQAGGGYNDADIEGMNPMGRFAMPDDIARAILFLADPEQSGFVNGQALAVDGGWTTDGSWQSLRMRKRGDDSEYRWTVYTCAEPVRSLIRLPEGFQDYSNVHHEYPRQQ